MKISVININGRDIAFSDGQTILAAAASARIAIPSLCHDERVAAYGACGICVVEDEGGPRLLRACSVAAKEGMRIITESERLSRARRAAL